MKAAQIRTATHFVLVGLLALTDPFSALHAKPAPAEESVPPPPMPPMPPIGGEVDGGAGFRVPAGQTHDGDVYRIRGSVEIEGTLDGDLTCLAGTVRVPGRVTGDIFAAGSNVEITGSAGDSARLYAGDVVIDGPIDGELIVSGGSIHLGPHAVIKGDAQIYAKDVVIEGRVSSDLFVRAGVLDFRGKVDGDADVVVEKFNVGPDARIEGDLSYGARDKLDLDSHVVGGDITYDGRREKSASSTDHYKPSRRIDVDTDDDEFGGFPGRVFRFFAALVAYSVTIRMARNAMAFVQSASGDVLQSVGVGFIAVLTPFAAIITSIGIITIPLVVLYLFLWVVAFYLSGIAPALWIGRFILNKLNRSGASVYLALTIGLAVLYLAYAIPFIGWFAWFGVTLWGLGALVIGGRSYWATRKGGAPPAAPEIVTPIIEPPPIEPSAPSPA